MQHEFYRDILEFNGHKVVGHAYNGSECIEKICRMERKCKILPDFIIMDHRMPVKNGLETLSEILKLKPDLKVIIISADDSVKEKALSEGAVAFISKPINMDKLVRFLDDLIHQYLPK